MPQPVGGPVLIVDDSVDFLEVTVVMVQSNGYEVNFAVDEASARASMLKRPPLFALVSIDLVDLDWRAFVRVLRALPGPSVVVIGMSAGACTAHDIRDAQSLSDHFLEKPLDYLRLEAIFPPCWPA